MTLLLKLSAAAILLAATAIVPGCLNASQEAAVQSAIAANKVKVSSYCMTDIEPILNDPLVTLGTSLAPAAAQTVAVFRNICDLNNLDAVSASASTFAYLVANKVNITSNGQQLAPVIAPAPITAATLPAAS